MAVIRELDIGTINKIAAGEVVQRPSSALKELIENSLDALSTSIQVKIIDGGLKLLQISDNGSGIHPSDYSLLCKRFATSKIQTYDDLSHLQTFGFRGEALSSISQVSKVTVCSRKQGEALGYKGSFLEGNLIEGPDPFALDKGTLFKAENMFYNMQDRLRGLGNHNEEYKACLDIVQKYSLHYNSVGFKIMKSDTNDFATSGKEERVDILKKILKSNDPNFFTRVIEIPETRSEYLDFEGIFSSNESNIKNNYFALFINNRLVECKELKNMITGIYTSICPRVGSNYLAYFSLKILPQEIDVNVHPTKREVRFNHQSRIFSEIQTKVEETLKQSSLSKSLNIRNISANSTSGPAPSQKVREDHQEQKLDWFLVNKITAAPKVAQEELTSIEELKEEVKIGREQEILNNFSYVGAIDKNRILIQHNTSLYLCFAPTIIEALVYQFLLERFGQFPCYEIKDSDLDIPRLVDFALNLESVKYDQYKNGSRTKIIAFVNNVLNQQAGLLDEYFSFGISDDKILRIPLLLEGQIQPDVNNLPEFILRMGLNINWNQEKDCLEGLTKLFA